MPALPGTAPLCSRKIQGSPLNWTAIIARDLENPEGLLRRLTGLSLVDVEWDVELRINRYRLSSVVADWLAERWAEPAFRIAREIGYLEALQNLDNLAKQLVGTGLKYWEMLARLFPAGEDDV